MIFGALLILCLATCLFEGIALLLLHDRKKWLAPSLLCNVITNPILNMVLPFLYSVVVYWTDIFSFFLNPLMLICLEIGVIYMEAWLYGFFVPHPFKRRLKVSCAVNAFSFVVGLLFNDIFIELFRIFLF
ncbi:MAG: hypothetical protein IJ506_05810 [Clostridia bacterium]|nr:hypothetical protein [Clostridia bacterium]